MLRVYPVEHGCAVDLRSVQLGLVMLPVSRYTPPAYSIFFNVPYIPRPCGCTLKGGADWRLSMDQCGITLMDLVALK